MDTPLSRPDPGTPDTLAPLDPAECYRALETRDARFDGRFFTGITSTGIYCRPVCPARTPLFRNCRFFASAAAAQGAGFRPCLRCRPETAPETGAWRGSSSTVTRGLALINEGALDGEGGGIAHLAERLGIGERQLRRLFGLHLGASPLAIAQARRIHLARQLIHETSLGMAEVAAASGFGSLRQFNETFRRLYGRPPGSLRRQARTGTPSGPGSGITVHLRYRPPYDWPSMLAYLEARAIPGMERVDGAVYARTVAIGNASGTVEIRHHPASQSLAATVRFPELHALPAIIARIRRVFDLGADIATINAHLAADPLLAPLVAARPGLRAPGGWDGFELGIRAILGQQVTVAAGRQLAGRLLQLCGGSAGCGGGGLGRTFPSPEAVVAADLSAIGMPAARRQALKALAEATLRDPDLFRPASDMATSIARLRAIRGIGEWTAQYIALRVIRESDAFPAGDVGIQRGATQPGGRRPDEARMLRLAESWRPWRAYAAQHLWAHDPGT